MSPTTARGLLETLKTAGRVNVVDGVRLPWGASLSTVMLIARQKKKKDKVAPSVDVVPQRTLFETLPAEPAILLEKRDLQPWLSKQTPKIDQTTFKLTWVDSHKTPSIGTRKPDIIHHVGGCAPSVYTIASLGDLKSQTAGSSGSPSDDAVGCLVDFMCALAAVQVWRRCFTGYLLDGKFISFFVANFDVCSRRGDPRALVSGPCLSPAHWISESHSLTSLQVDLTQSVPMLCSGTGGRFLRGLLETPIGNTGYSLPVVSVRSPVVDPAAGADDCEAEATMIAIDGVLGLGGTATVFGGSVVGQRCAVKIPDFAAVADSAVAVERAALARLAVYGVRGVPHIVCDAIDESVLITGPVGSPIASCAFDVHIALHAHRNISGRRSATLPRLIDSSLCHCIVATLRDMHAAGVIQGDMRLSNLVSVIEGPAPRGDPHGRSAAITTFGGAGPAVAVAAHAAVIIDFGSAFIAKKLRATQMWRFKRVRPAVWISLPYAHPDVLRAYASNTHYRPAPCHDLFMLAASLHRLLVPWAPCSEVKNEADAEYLVQYWELLMAPFHQAQQPRAAVDRGYDELVTSATENAAVSTMHKRRRLDPASALTASAAESIPSPVAGAGGASCEAAAEISVGLASQRSSSLSSQLVPGAVSPWGVLFDAADAYDLPFFEVAMMNAVRSVVPDWPW